MFIYFAVAVLLAVFGAWRIAVGLFRLGLIERRVPHTDGDKSLPKFMQAGDDVNGLVALLGGFFSLLASVASVWAGFTQ